MRALFLVVALANGHSEPHCSTNEDCANEGIGDQFCNADLHEEMGDHVGDCEPCYYPGDLMHNTAACDRYAAACCGGSVCAGCLACRCGDETPPPWSYEPAPRPSDGCAAGTADLRVDLYDGVVRDADPTDDGTTWGGDSDAYCVLYVGSSHAVFSGLFYDSNAPVFNEFFAFSCQPIDARIHLECFDYDYQYLPLRRFFHLDLSRGGKNMKGTGTTTTTPRVRPTT